ncbi:hypothetical protein EVAR_567_1 [Eumeta japonica]|uniref:Uncharacterized protein n=1 Tax=Eumeta variegata TaxID=151549 RepID=A0A4C1SDY9_EUMVA|nr:hypothetical protein EVAR_567_1 [Eumeta japonica]
MDTDEYKIKNIHCTLMLVLLRKLTIRASHRQESAEQRLPDQLVRFMPTKHILRMCLSIPRNQYSIIWIEIRSGEADSRVSAAASSCGSERVAPTWRLIVSTQSQNDASDGKRLLVKKRSRPQHR